MKLINEHDKTYITKIVFGYDSDTLDIDGNITDNISMSFTNDMLINALNELKNSTKQIPPMVSAIKIDGKKMYELARKGIEIDIPARDIKIYNYEILSEMKLVDNHLEVDILLDVSKGFYVRSFARDLGKLLGGCAIMKELRRIKTGYFDIKMANKIENITTSNIVSIYDIFKFKRVQVNDYIAKLVKNGIILDERQVIINEPFYVINNNEVIAIYEPFEENKYKPLLIF
jgi:tRNA pseudouridine55 synthase